MDKYKEAILDYEKKRRAVATLDKKRRKLISNCKLVDRTDYHSKICLVIAFEDTKNLCRSEGEYYTYDEVLFMGNGEGDYCDNCLAAFELKKGKLAEARQRFGHAKQTLSALGKILDKI